ncbi:unnamed protein product [Polarella glacialis]|uniref:S1 motif domain-containing protein n=1 Tax=Polarella glacialis TaxID=89957 RepID=A0A813FFM1_POLGL|nr:unnamed protein product [Polarella glacialis]CAE8623310.1 unnamed protein product [Polarella glacialis]|mmetsp:Transcript_56778/g.91880  ORF Transcript_56778/g.91880 Transcript_56778/m.91880 type:complete len:343 (+) Transcript_56778:165-1193(+)|eukprot:CAMPEP_0115112010 /NCGR_PEP_ID=MMETSP0227-20121206/40402_1 /TAXON_ID=89957 /ORGANISM="Polarella glacialis, Strain CCMP 1383" /LENGTH=342 /DNA_ID=CAMNT_0002511529 /DNA_START=76 /DNA_END=1104 /DNA_ORIENTATION=-
MAAAEEPRTFMTHGRFYEDEFPEVETTVLVQVNKVDDKTGAYVSLLEYDNREGMINIGELSKKRIRSMLKVLRVGSTEVCMVMSVDEDKGYINLSKKRVEPEDVPPKQELFAKAKAVHGIMQHVASNHELDIEELCNKISWPLNKKYPSAYDAFKKHVEEEINVWDEIDFSKPGQDLTELADKIKEDVELHMRRRLINSVLRLQAKIEVSCNDYEGIDAIKQALKEGFKANKDECEVSIKLIAHPVFSLTCMCRDKELGLNTLTECMNLIQQSIESNKGQFVILSKPEIARKEETKESDDEDSDEEGDEEDQDETMGNLDDAALAELAKAKLDDDGDDDTAD